MVLPRTPVARRTRSPQWCPHGRRPDSGSRSYAVVHLSRARRRQEQGMSRAPRDAQDGTGSPGAVRALGPYIELVSRTGARNRPYSSTGVWLSTRPPSRPRTRVCTGWRFGWSPRRGPRRSRAAHALKSGKPRRASTQTAAARSRGSWPSLIIGRWTSFDLSASRLLRLRSRPCDRWAVEPVAWHFRTGSRATTWPRMQRPPRCGTRSLDSTPDNATHWSSSTSSEAPPIGRTISP
jgi:hypothetical protein